MRPKASFIAASLFVLCNALSAWAAEGTSIPAQKSKITIAEYGEYPLYVVLYIAAGKGFFADEGLEVKIVPAGGDEKVFAALLSGDAQFGLSDPSFVAISGQRGRPGRVIYSVLKNIPAWGVAIDPKVPQIAGAADLKGLKVATFAAPSTSYTLQKRMFQSAGLEPKIVQLAWGTLLPALEAGRVDIALENEPNVALAEHRGARRVYGLQQYYSEFAFTGLMVLPEYLVANPETVQHVVNAFKRASDVLSESPETAVEVLSKRFPELPPAVLDKAVRSCLQAGIFSADGVMSRKGWEAAVEMRTAVGDLKAPAPFEEYVVTRFAEAASGRQASR